MSIATDTRVIRIVTACMRSDGLPAFALSEVEVTEEQAENGIHYYLAEAELLQQGFEEPMVHFPEGDAPAFLFPAVEEHLAAKSALEQFTLAEET